MFGRSQRDRSQSERRGAAADLLVLGLGNPGEKYAGTRHNVGAEVVEVLASRSAESLKATKFAALVAETHIGGKSVVLAFPTTFMNESGLAARQLMRRYGIEDPAKMLVVYDELDLDVGRLKLKVSGGFAGHNGLKSINQHCKTPEFLRLRVGIGRPPGSQRGADYVLRRPGKADRSTLDVSIERAADAVEQLVEQGAAATMNDVNRSDQ